MEIPKCLKPVPLLPKQKEQFFQYTEQHFRQFLWIPIVLIVLIQLNNIIHLLHHNNFNQLSHSNIIYICFYISLFFCSTCMLFILFYKKLKTGILIRIQTAYHLFLLMWGIGKTLYNQRVSSSISIYLVISMCVAIFSYLAPVVSVSAFTTAQIILMVGIPLLAEPESGDFYGRIINLFIVNSMSALISCYRFYISRTDFLNSWIMAEQNRKIRNKNLELEYWANHDSLTGLFNQRYLSVCVRKMLEHPGATAAICMMDIDDFKSYNDYYGHIKGDECLSRIAQTMQSQISKGQLFRYGGEEFLYLLPDADPNAALETARQLCRAIEGLKIPSSAAGSIVTISAGFCHAPISKQQDWEQLLKKADQALYDAKRNGKNQLYIR